MRVRVSFRYDSETGEVQLLQMDQAEGEPRGPEHDRRHHAAAADLARIVERNALIEEADQGASVERVAPERSEPQQQRQAERRTHEQS